MIRGGVGLFLALAALGGAAATTADASRRTSALIRPGVGIGKFRLGMTEQQVRRAAGRPTYVLPRGRVSFGQRRVEWQYGQAAGYILRLVGRPGRMRVNFVSTVLRRERTAQGIGTGSRESALRAAYPAVRCGSLNPPVPPGAPPNTTPYVAHERDCTLFRGSGARTVFRTEIDARFGVTAPEYLRKAVIVEIVVALGPCRRWSPVC